MKKLYRGRIWVIILLSIIASQNTFATQTIQGQWVSTSLYYKVWDIVDNNRRVDIEENQYAFILTEEAEVTIKLTNIGDGYLYLFRVNNSGDIERLASEDGTVETIDGVHYDTVSITQTLSSGSYFFVPTTWAGDTFDPPRDFTVEITIVSSSGNDDGNLTGEVVLVNADGSIPNEATQFSGDTSASGNEDSTITGTLIATDVEGLADGKYFTITTSPSNGGASINESSGVWQIGRAHV